MRFGISFLIVHSLISFDHLIDDFDLLFEEFHQGAQLILHVVDFEQILQVIRVIEGSDGEEQFLGCFVGVCDLHVAGVILLYLAELLECFGAFFGLMFLG